MLTLMEWGFVINLRPVVELVEDCIPSCGNLGLSTSFANFRRSPLNPGIKPWQVSCEGIITAGGDGTIHWLAHSLRGYDQKPMLLPWPMGTGNDCAKFLGWPRKPPQRRPLPAFVKCFRRCNQG